VNLKRTEPHGVPGGRVLTLALAASAMALAPLGCGGGPEMAGVSGRVTYNGKPVSKGTISFVSTDPDRPNATGQLDANGRYRLQTHEPGDGARLGDYDVTIYTHQEERLQYVPKTPQKVERLTPEKYENPKTSGLKRTVKSGSNSIDLELTD
jgi:hypothetical protein